MLWIINNYDNMRLATFSFFAFSSLCSVYFLRCAVLHTIGRNKNYVIALSYYDQLTWGAIRLRSLQCWAKYSKQYMADFRIVEPFVTGTHFNFPTTNGSLEGSPSFGNFFDLDVWNKFGSELNFPSVVNWNDFLKHAPRDVILVQIVYEHEVDKLCPETAFSNTTCNPEGLKKFWSRSLKRYNFTVQREVCIDFPRQGFRNVQTFNNQIFGRIPANFPVTIIFDEWRGNVKMIKCFIRLYDLANCSPLSPNLTNLTHHSLVLAPKIIKAANRYMERHLSGASGYSAIVIRWEKILLYDFYFQNSTQFLGSKCIAMIENFLDEVYRTKQLDVAFIATDLGKYGSSTFQLYDSARAGIQNVTRYTEELLRQVYCKAMTWSDYEREFEVVSETTNPAFISQLQKAVAARAECLLLVGWGTFHEHTLKLYKDLHVGNLCYKVIEVC